MNGPVQNRRRGFLLLLAPFLLASTVLPAVRSDAAEAETVTAAEIVDGLKKIESSVLQVADYAGGNKAKAEKVAGEIEPVWSKIEATVKANNKDSYAAFEKAIDEVEAAAKAGNAKEAGGAAEAFSSAVKTYAAEYPAGFSAGVRSAAAAPAEAPKPAPAAPRESAAAPAAEAGDATLARTGPHDGVIAMAGAAFGLGGLALIGGARRRRSPSV